MKLFETILIATDGSEKNRAALDAGLRIARSCGSHTWVIYVIDTNVSAPVQYGTALASPGEPEINVDSDSEARQITSQIRTLAGDTPITMVIRRGKPAREIVRFAAEKTADLIIIGSLGKGGLERVLLGSVSDEVVRTASGNVLVVKG